MAGTNSRITALLALALLAVHSGSSVTRGSLRPQQHANGNGYANVVLVMADDMGYGDLGANMEPDSGLCPKTSPLLSHPIRTHHPTPISRFNPRPLPRLDRPNQLPPRRCLSQR